MGNADGIGAGGQTVALSDGLGQVLRPLRPGLFQAPGHGAGQQVVGDAGGQGVDGHDTAGVLPALLRLEDGVGHPLPPLGALYRAIKHIGLPHLQGGADVALTEKGEIQHSAVVRRSETGHFPSLGDAGGAGRFHHHSRHAAFFSHRCALHWIHRPAVFILPWKPAEQVIRRLQP